MIRKKLFLVMAFLVIAGGSFYGGTFYEKKQGAAKNSTENINPGTRPSRRDLGTASSGIRRGGEGNEFVAGEIIAKEAESVTVKIKEGESQIVYFSDSTTIGKAVEGSVVDLTVGGQVMINGKKNQEGSLTAQNIQIRPLP